MTRTTRAAFAVLVVLALLAAACGGSDDGARTQAQADYRAYRSAEDARTDAEGRLRLAIHAIAREAGERDRGGVLSAATRGQIVAADIHRLIDRELAAAARLTGYKATSEQGGRLARGLRATRRGLQAVERELEIAREDPFLDLPENEHEIGVLARQVVEFSRVGELAIRRADRAIAVELGIEPRYDPIFDRPGSGERS